MSSPAKSKLNDEGQEFKNIKAAALEGHNRAIALLHDPKFIERMNNWQRRKNAENNASRTRKAPTRKNLNEEGQEIRTLLDLASTGHPRAVAITQDPDFVKRMKNWEQKQGPKPQTQPQPQPQPQTQPKAPKPLAPFLQSALPQTAALVNSSVRHLNQLKRAKAQLAHLGRQPTDAELAAELKKVQKFNILSSRKKGGKQRRTRSI
jgi:hypothetical protein